MKSLIFFLILFSLVSCGKKYHEVPRDLNSDGSFQECDGELWGYLVDPVKPTQGGFLRDRDPDVPYLSVFLHMHPDFEENPPRALGLFYVIQTQKDTEITYRNPVVRVTVDGVQKDHRLELSSTSSAKAVWELYPRDQYEIIPVRNEPNKFKVGKMNPWLLNFVTGGYESVTVSEDLINRNLDEKKINATADWSRYSKIFLQYYTQIWPHKEPLKDAKISVKTPAMVIDGHETADREFVFNMNYEKVKKLKEKRRGRRCPSTAEIFRFKI